jgi:hypothetical protein
MDEQERQERWSKVLKSIRLMAATSVPLLAISLLAPVISLHVTPLILLLATGPAILWLLTWTWEGRPPAGWHPNSQRLESNRLKMERMSRRHLLVGLALGVPAILLAILLGSHH